MEGGYLKAPRAVSCETFAWSDKKEEKFTPVSKSEPWLVEAVASKHVTTRCLKRSTVFQDLRQAALRSTGDSTFAPTAVGQDRRLAALHYDEDVEDQVVSTPVPKKRRQAKPQEEAHGVASPEKALAGAGMGVPVVVRMRPTASAGAEKLVNVNVVLRGQRLLLGVSSVPWLVKYLAQELEDGGVAVEEEASAAADASAGTIYWDFRDSAWVARAKTPGGENVTKRTSIHRRMTTPGDSLCGLSRTDAKAAAHEELRSWREAVLEGQLAPEGAAADVASFRV